MTTTTTLADAVTAAFLAGDTEALLALCADDLLVELVVPQWRFQITGHEATRQGLVEGEFLPGRNVTWHQRTDLADGMLLELESNAPMHGEPHRWFELNKFRFADGQIVEIVQYCSGFQDAATAARNDAEAPLVRHR
jgi:hypothetical protein